MTLKLTTCSFTVSKLNKNKLRFLHLRQHPFCDITNHNFHARSPLNYLVQYSHCTAQLYSVLRKVISGLQSHLPITPSAVNPSMSQEGGRIRFKYAVNDNFSRFAAGPFQSQLFPVLPVTGIGLLYRLDELKTIAVHGSDARVC